MSIKTFLARVEKAELAIKTINEAAAAATAELTRQASNGPTPEVVTFTIPTDGINLGQLQKELKQNCGVDVEISVEGSTVTIKTANARAAARVIKKLGISVDIEGTVNGNLHTDNRDAVAA